MVKNNDVKSEGSSARGSVNDVDDLDVGSVITDDLMLNSNDGDDSIEYYDFDVNFVEDNDSFAPIDYDLLPQEFQKEIDDLATELLDPEKGHVAVLGTTQSGKTFFVNQLVGNFKQYSKRFGTKDMLFIQVDDDKDYFKLLSSKKIFNDYVDALCEQYDRDENNICFVLDDKMFAAEIFNYNKRVRILFEATRTSFMNIVQKEKADDTKIWSSWLYFDVADVALLKKDLVEIIYNGVSERIVKQFGVVLDRSMISSFVNYTVKNVPGIKLSEGEYKNRIVVPVGVWLSIARRIGVAIKTWNPDKIYDKNGKLKFLFIVKEIVNNNLDIFEFYSEDEDDFIGEIVIMGPDGNEITIPIPSDLKQNFPLEKEARAGGDSDTSKKSGNDFVFSNIYELSEKLGKNVIGQDEAISSVVDGLVVPAAGLNDKNRPIRSMLFLGPTGVGKTETALSLAREVSTEPLNVVRIDMSEFGQSHEVAKLFGAPPGYAGSDKGGVLTNAVAKNPKSIVLLDEIEKAHPKVWESLLQLLDSGRMTDGRGKEVDFTQTIVIMTSNIGARETQHKNIGFNYNTDEQQFNIRKKESNQIVMKALEKVFSPEFINRIDEKIVFNEISKEIAYKIVDKEVSKIKDTIKKSDITLQNIPQEIIDEVVRQSNVEKYGAREIQRNVYKNISNPIAHNIIKNNSLKENEEKNNNDIKRNISLIFDNDNKTITVENQ